MKDTLHKDTAEPTATSPGNTASQAAKNIPEVEILSDSDDKNMPGSNKKKRHASSAKPDEAAQGDGVDKDLKAFLIAMKEDINRTTNAAVDKIDRRIDENSKQIAELKQGAQRRDAELDSIIASKVRQEVAKIGEKVTGTDSKLANKRETSYNLCRRTLKMWPIRSDDKVDEIRSFLANQLGFDTERIRALGDIELGRAPGKKAQERGEILAVFETKEDRDAVKAGGINLAGKKDVGMSVHVPGHLMDNLVALNGVGFLIKNKHNGVKRAIKFDDQRQDIYLDICINNNWRRITPAEARTAMEKNPQMSNTTGNLSLDDLTNLIQGEAVEGLTAVVLPGDDEEE